MYAILIKFPFRSINDEKFELSLYAARSGEYSDALNAMNDDPKSFKYISSQTSGNDYVRTYEGTLVGDVVSEDDNRDDVFVPLATSKLKFNIMCKEFPSWLMDICDYYTNVKVVLAAIHGTTKVERWRGFLMANTLNMTVVNELMSCPLVAVDEIAIAKYLKFKENYQFDNFSPTLLDLFYYYWQTMVSSNSERSMFSQMYSVLGMTVRNNLILSRDMRYYDATERDVLDIMSLTINVNRYFLDKEATWENIFKDVCEYIGVTLCMGSKDATGNDNYILADANYNYHEYLLYSLGLSGYSRVQVRPFANYNNPMKVGGNLQVTYKPQEWKGVSVKSVPHRPPTHNYLEDDNVKPIEPAASHGKWCETRIGKKRNTSPLTTIDDYGYRVFQYCDIVDKEGQWIPENKYVQLEGCNVAGDARTVGIGKGYFPLSDSALGQTRPNGTNTDSMDFALSKWGMIAAKIGRYDTIRQKISASLKNYFVILNNKWGRLYWNDDEGIDDTVYSQKTIATFTPFADDKSVIPNNEAYLAIDMSALFLNENIGDNIAIVENNRINDNLKEKIQAVFPITDSDYNWEAGDSEEFTGDLTATSTNIVNSFYPYLIARIHIGNHVWNGTDWIYYDNPSNGPTFHLPLIPDSVDQYWIASSGLMHKDVKNYYYVECRPRMGASDNVFRIPLSGVSTHQQPLKGKVVFEVLGRIPYISGHKYDGVTTNYNNILFVLLSDISIQFTDEAYYQDTDIDVTEKVEPDAYSTTKKTKEVVLRLSTPKVDGVFENCLVYDDGVNWINLQHVHRADMVESTPEALKASDMASIFCNKQEFVEFTTFFSEQVDNIYNVGFTIRGLTESSGIYMPITRRIDWTGSKVKLKLQRVGNGGRSFNHSYDDSYNV